LGSSIREAAYIEALYQAPTLETEDAKEGVSALLEKRTPFFQGQ